MKSTRLRSLPENKLDTVLTTLEQQVAALSSATQFTGGSSIVFFQSETGAAYDWTGTLPSGIGQVFLLVQATAATMPNLYCNILCQLFVGSPTSLYTPADAYSDIVGGVNTPFYTSLFNVPNSSLDGALNQVIIEITGDTTRAAYVKVYALALDNVTLTVTEL